MFKGETYLILGGGGMVGQQIAYQVSKHLDPRRVIVASLYEEEVREAIEALGREFPSVEYVPFWGDVFVRAEWNARDQRDQLTRRHLLATQERRTELQDDLFGGLDDAYERSQLVQLILEHRPDVVVDGINTATAISYQNVYSASAEATQQFAALRQKIEAGGRSDDLGGELEATQRALDVLLLSQSIPQLIRHTFLVYRALSEVGARLYLKIGTTGTGGMGMNIPYTHSEDRPSATLMTKTAVAFAHTGLMFLMARTADGPIVKELKPGAMVGYSDITRCEIRDRGGHGGYAPYVYRYLPQRQPLEGCLIRRDDDGNYERQERLSLVVADTGENGLFAKGEFEAITHTRQMEFMTPEEIAQQARMEIAGWNTGYDVIAAVDSAVINPTYRAGTLRHQALEELCWLERETDTPSVAIGQLGPPELGKLLWESYLLARVFGTLQEVLNQTPEEVSRQLNELLEGNEALRSTITATGIPILTPDGGALVRGPFIRIPEKPGMNQFEVTPQDLELWAAKGWVDLRPQNMVEWQSRFETMERERQRRRGRGSAAITREVYLMEHISPGSVVAWIFNNELDDEGQLKYGYRIK